MSINSIQTKSMPSGRLLECDFIRAICAIGIILYHCACYSAAENYYFLPPLSNGNWGNTLVTIFFILSGAMLYKNNAKIDSLKKFYYKRWKSLFPMFYIAFLGFYLLNVVRMRSFFYAGDPKLLLLSFIGMDGYLAGIIPNYYILGEWFLGAIIILYLLYPLVLWVFKRFDWILTLGLVVLFLFQAHTDIFVIDGFTNIISCLVSFEIGMLIMKYRLWENKIVLILAVAGTAVMACVKLPFNHNVASHILGISLFFVLFYVGKISRFEFARKMISFVSDLSYPIFLLQHLVVWHVLSRINPTENWKVFVVELGIILIIVVAAKVLQWVNTFILTSRIYKKIEGRLIK